MPPKSTNFEKNENIIFYIKRIIEKKQDRYVLYAYDVENNEEIEINTGLDDLQHLAISADGQKIALCGIVPGRLWVGDLVINWANAKFY